MSTTGIKKNHFFLHFFCFFYLFFRILFAFFFYGKPVQRKTHGKGRTERRAEQQEARCAEITPAPVWNGATRTGSRTAADGKTAPIKKAPPCGEKAFLNEKNCGRAGGPSLWRAVEHRWVIFVCALLFCILRFRMFFGKGFFAFFYFFIITGNFLDD